MSYITRDIPDLEYAAILTSFLNAAAENADALGLSSVEIEAMSVEFAAYQQAAKDVVTARAEYAAAVTAKEEQKANARAIVSGAARMWRANTSIPGDILDKVMVAPHSTPKTLSAPTTVTNVTITNNEVGELTIRWNANGNIPKTLYLIETAPTGSGPWTLVATVTAKKFRMPGTPGTPIWIRVSAQRRGISSNPCNAVSLWADGSAKLVA